MLKPAELEFLLHCHIYPDPHPCIKAYTYACTARWFVDHDILEVDAMQPDMYRLTKRGRAWLHLFLNVPMPVQAWVDAQGKVIETEVTGDVKA